MNVLTYASYREHFKLYPEIQDSVTVNKTIILLSSIYVILCRAVQRTSVKDRYKNFSLPAGTHSIGSFNAIVKVAVLKEMARLGDALD